MNGEQALCEPSDWNVNDSNSCEHPETSLKAEGAAPQK
jgi:hypothetical protein